MHRAPVEMIAFTMRHIAGLENAFRSNLFPNFDPETLDAVLHEAGRFASEELEPLAQSGDRQGARLQNGNVALPDGWPALYQLWRAGGWNGLSAPEDYGGQALPQMLNMAVLEIWNSCSLSFALAPTLTMGAIEALVTHGSDVLKEKYLPKLVSGEWTGTMNLTEPQAGSDLSLIRTRAEPQADGSYRLFGQKIFITWGEHDATENIIHLVLARLPDAPAGTRGLSLFLVPKLLVNDDGSLGDRNDLFCLSLENKLGIHASPTCTMIYGDGAFGAEKGALGWLVGEENKGLACMFTMMNNARLAVAIQGVAVGEAATQKAMLYAQQRHQGKTGAQSDHVSAIAQHPDVARMLLTMKVLTQGGRSISYACAHAIDMAAQSGELFWRERAALLTPIAKAFATDAGVDIASLGIQVHGGMGFIEETGAARYWRDARIAPIYEGTNGIQAIDLVMRKLTQSSGAHIRQFIAELRFIADQVTQSTDEDFRRSAEKLVRAIEHLKLATDWMLARHTAEESDAALAGASAYLKLFGLVLTGCYLAKGGLVDGGDPLVQEHRLLFRFAASHNLVETSGLHEAIVYGADSLEAAKSLLR